MLKIDISDFLLFPNANLQDHAQLGDYVGGILGTAASLTTLIALFLTLRYTIRTDIRNGEISILSEMLKTHDHILSISDKSYLSKEGPPAVFLSEFYEVYKLTHNNDLEKQQWSTDDKIDIAYTFTYYGPTSQAIHDLNQFDQTEIRTIHDQISTTRNLNREAERFKGHQRTISHYMRNLFAMYSTIDASKLSQKQKNQLGKIVKSKLSNYEQALLSLNVISHFGREWEREEIISKYKPFSNIPKQFFSFDDTFSLKERFPHVKFEWENAKKHDVRSRTFSVFQFHITVSY